MRKLDSCIIKEKRRLRPQYSQAHDPLVKTLINQFQKEIKDNLGINHRLVGKILQRH